MRCPVCGAYGSPADNFCRRCGASRRNLRLPVKRAPAAVVPWRRAAPAVVQGAALIAAGVAAEWLLRSAAKALVGLPAKRGKAAPSSKALAVKGDGSAPGPAVAVSETVVMRRVILRR